jgi:hypothetical protein
MAINFRGYVFQDDGDPVSGATVALLETGTTTQEDSTTTDSDGLWSFSESDQDRYDVKISSGTSVRYMRWDDQISLKEIDVRNNSAAATPAATFTNLYGSASNQVAVFSGANSTKADNDEIYLSFKMHDSAGNLDEFARMTVVATDVSTTTEDGQIEFDVMKAGTLTKVWTITSSTAGAMSYDLNVDALTIGSGADTDVSLTFDANSADGVITWMEDEDYFKFSDDILMNSTERINFYDTAIYIYSSTDGQLDLVADTEIQIAATTIDINGAVALNGAITGATNITLSGELDAATLDLSSSADIAGDLVLSGGADGALQFTNAGENSIKIPDNQASALIIEEANNAYITFVTTDSSEAITVAKATTFSAGIANSGTIAAGTWNGTAIASGYIAADAITGAKIADDAVDSEHYTDGSIDTAHLADDAITSAKIADDAITSALIADDAIVTAAIADDAITSALIADDAVTGATINNDVISAQSEITSGLAAADELLYSDGGTVKRVGLDTLTTYLAGVNAGTVTSTGLSDSSGVISLDIQNMTASSTIADADLIVIDDGAGGTLRKMTRANFIESAALDAINIDGGAIDGVTLGTNSAVTQAVIDNININGTTIGHTSDTDLLTLTSANLAVAGDVEVSGSVEVATIDYTDGDLAITIADGGGITAAQDISTTDAKYIKLGGSRMATAEPASDSTGYGIVIGFDSAGSVSAGDAVCINSSGKVAQANANAGSVTDPAIGIATNAAGSDGDDCYVLTHGIWRLDAEAFQAGDPVYVGESAGALTKDVPNDDGDYVQRIGVAVSDDVIFVMPSIDVIEHA